MINEGRLLGSAIALASWRGKLWGLGGGGTFQESPARGGGEEDERCLVMAAGTAQEDAVRSRSNPLLLQWIQRNSRLLRGQVSAGIVLPSVCFRSANFRVRCRITEQLKEQARSTEQEGTTKTWLLPACPVVQIQTGCMFPH